MQNNFLSRHLQQDTVTWSVGVKAHRLAVLVKGGDDVEHTEDRTKGQEERLFRQVEARTNARKVILNATNGDSLQKAFSPTTETKGNS